MSVQCKYCSKELIPNQLCMSNECQLKRYMEKKTDEFDQEQGIVKKNLLSDEFRICMLSPTKLDELVSDGTLDITTSADMNIRDKTFGWESMNPETLLVMMIWHQKHFQHFAHLYGNAKRKIDLKADLTEKTKKETNKAIEALNKIAEVKLEKKIKLSPFEKALNDCMKVMKCTREVAVEQVKLMGFTE